MTKKEMKNKKLANAFKNIKEEMKDILTDKQYDDFTNKLDDMYMQYYRKPEEVKPKTPKKVKPKTVGATITLKTIDRLWYIRNIAQLYGCITDTETKDIYYLSTEEIYNLWDKIPNKESLIKNYNDITTEKCVNVKYNINYSNVNKFFKQLLKENNWKRIDFDKLKTVPINWFERPIIVESSNELLANGELKCPAKNSDHDLIFDKETFPFSFIFNTHVCKMEKRIIYIKI